MLFIGDYYTFYFSFCKTGDEFVALLQARGIRDCFAFFKGNAVTAFQQMFGRGCLYLLLQEPETMILFRQFLLQQTAQLLLNQFQPMTFSHQPGLQIDFHLPDYTFLPITFFA